MGSADKKPQTTKNKNFLQSFKHALTGIVSVWHAERNMRFHLLATVVVIILAWLLKVPANQWVWLIVAIALVIAAECINTAVENICDLVVGTHFDSRVKKAKDAAAGAVLVLAVMAAIIGLMVFIPRLLTL